MQGVFESRGGRFRIKGLARDSIRGKSVDRWEKSFLGQPQEDGEGLIMAPS